jgi:serine/threonine-protein kinase
VAGELELLNQSLEGRYRVEREIGRGGTATVYRAHDLKHDRVVALKVLNPELAATVGATRFLREITLTARLDHPHILPLLDSGEAQGRLYYVMPFVDGESLRDRLRRERQLPLRDALRIAREIADALSYAHSHGVVHRDIKPENILLSGGHARVADFGIARALRASGADRLTSRGLAVGTVAYMSPEQASAERDVDERSDVYSLGCVVYEMLAGHPPHTGPTPEAIFARKLAELPPGIRVVRDTVPVWVEQAIATALAKVPADRFASVEKFAEALEGAERSALVAPGTARRGLPGWRALAPVVLAALAAALLVSDVGGMRSRLLRDGEHERIESLAVLPLENLSGEPDQDYFAAGIHEALIVQLGKLSGLSRVSARPSVLRYQHVNGPLRQVAADLGVGALITGSVLRVGNRVRITAHLIDPDTERELWGESYEREMSDVLALQNEVVSAIARQVQLRLSSAERAGLARSRPVDPRAYEAYLKGRYEINKFTSESFDSGMALLNEASAIDPTEPLVYAGLAHAYSLLEVLRAAPAPEALARARVSALKAVELDETLAEAHLALATVKMQEWDYSAAERSMRRALELNPNLPEAHVEYGQYLSIFGDPDEAVREYRRGIELDPLSPLYRAWLAGLFWELGRNDDAVVEARKALELAPDFPVALFVLGLVHGDRGEHEQAIAAHRRALEKHPYRNFSWILARTYARAGRMREAREIMARLERGDPGDAVHPFFIAGAYVAMGEHDKALDWLERAYDSRSFFLANLNRERAAGVDLLPLRNDARFRALQRRVKLLE